MLKVQGEAEVSVIRHDGDSIHPGLDQLYTDIRRCGSSCLGVKSLKLILRKATSSKVILP